MSELIKEKSELSNAYADEHNMHAEESVPFGKMRSMLVLSYFTSIPERFGRRHKAELTFGIFGHQYHAFRLYAF